MGGEHGEEAVVESTPLVAPRSPESGRGLWPSRPPRRGPLQATCPDRPQRNCARYLKLLVQLRAKAICIRHRIGLIGNKCNTKQLCVPADPVGI